MYNPFSEIIQLSNIRTRQFETLLLFSQVIHVEGTDDDCSPHFGDICDYQIESQGQPFSISKEGMIKLWVIQWSQLSHQRLGFLLILQHDHHGLGVADRIGRYFPCKH